MPKRPMTGRPLAAQWGVGAVLMFGLFVACDSTASSSSSATTEHLGSSVALTNDGCTHAGPMSLSAEDGQLTIPVANDSDFIAVVSLLKVGSAFDSVAAEVDDYNDAESVGEAFELTANPDVTQAAEVRVDPSGEGELSADVTADTYAVLCLGEPADGRHRGTRRGLPLRSPRRYGVAPPAAPSTCSARIRSIPSRSSSSPNSKSPPPMLSCVRCCTMCSAR